VDGLLFGKGFSGAVAVLAGAAMSSWWCGADTAAGSNAFSAGAGPDQEHVLGGAMG
jgi:hypothetical protein